MMKMFFWLLLLPLLYNEVHAQQRDFTKVYYPFVRKAEIAITYHSFKEAIANYKQAFSAVEHPFAKDYYNASLSALQLKDFALAGEYVGLLMDKGIDTAFFRKPVFASLRKHKTWKRLMRTYPERRKRYISRIDTALYQEILSLVEKDQYFRRKEGSYEMYGSEIREADSVNMRRVKQIIVQYGYPDENRLGIYDNNFAVSPLQLILRHHYQNGVNDLSDVLLEQVKNGKLSAREFAQHEDVNLQGYRDTYFTKLDTTMIIEHSLLPGRIHWINQNRLSAGLETLEEWKRKILFELNETLFLPLEQYHSARINGFYFEGTYGVMGFIGDRSFNDQYLQRTPPQYILTKDVLEKLGIKQVYW
jgi:hypothetical protein